jgi:hypothetical protein
MQNQYLRLSRLPHRHGAFVAKGVGIHLTDRRKLRGRNIGLRSRALIGRKPIGKRAVTDLPQPTLNAGRSRVLDHGHDHMCLYFGGNLAASVSDRDFGRGAIGRSLQLVCISGYDLVA